MVQPLERALWALKLALVPALIVAAALPTLRALIGSSGSGPNAWLPWLGAVAFACLYALLLQTDALDRRVDRLFARLRRRIAVACNHDDGSEHAEARLACRLTADALRAPLFRYDEQQHAVVALAAACVDEQTGRFWFIEGESGSGKTRTALLLVQTLVRDLRLFELGSRCFLYDFAESNDAQQVFLRRLGSSRHDGAVVLVDNFQLVQPRVLRAVTARLVDRPTASCERLVLFLARPRDAWNLSPGSDVRLLSEAKVAGHHLELAGPGADAVARTVAEFDSSVAERLRDLESGSVASAAQLHLAQVIGRAHGVPPDISELLGLLSDPDAAVVDRDLLALLAVLSALAMHRGGLPRGELLRGLLIAARHGSPKGVVKVTGLAARFRRMRRVGLVSSVPASDHRYVFHEAIARLCIDRLSAVSEFSGPFEAIGRTRLRQLRLSGDDLSAWLVGVEIGAQPEVAELFDGAISKGAYQRMVRCLERAAARYSLSEALTLELAILRDRTGDFRGSRQLVTDELSSSIRSMEGLAAVLAALRVETSHDPASEAGIQALTASPDRRTAVVGEYWHLHIAGHRGTFAPEQMLALATETAGLIREQPSYWLTSSLARMRFDALRHHYLAGGLPVGAIATPAQRKLDDHLRSRLPTFQALHVLYGQAHLVGHVLLPGFALFSQSVDPNVAALAEITPEDSESVDRLTEVGRRLYHRAHDEFWQYGDREASYLQADLLNAEMIVSTVDLDTMPIRLHEYQRFIVEADFKELLSYPHLYFLRWHMLKYYAALLDPYGHQARTADEHFSEAWRHVRCIKQLDAVARNDYGLLRADLLSLLLRGVREPFGRHRLEELHGRAQRSGYGFEQRLLERLLETPKLTSAELRAIFRFYPFVHQ